MFKRHPKEIEGLVKSFLRANGLETPYLQHRLIAAWDEVAGSTAASHTTEKYIRNQTLFVHIDRPVVRQELNMRRTALVQQLNSLVGSHIITDIRFL